LTAASAGSSAFDRATAVAPAGAGRWAAICQPDWGVPTGPNGGYLAAIVLRAMEAELADPGRAARSLTCHYLRPPAPDGVIVETVVERSGRTASTLTARLLQGDRLCVLAIAVFSDAREGAHAWAPVPPPAPPPEHVPVFPVMTDSPSMASHFELRPVFGGLPFSGAAEALTGGWLRFVEARALDAPSLALFADAWLPAPFPRLRTPVAAPTLDLTVHFRAPEAVAALAPAEPVLVRFVSRASAGGFFEEDGEIYSREGVLLAQSRQLGLL
jgi:acyl-CoA thioesterase